MSEYKFDKLNLRSNAIVTMDALRALVGPLLEAGAAAGTLDSRVRMVLADGFSVEAGGQRYYVQIAAVPPAPLPRLADVKPVTFGAPADPVEEKRLAGPGECMHWKDAGRTAECFAPAKWYAHVDWADLRIEVCDDHKEQIEREDGQQEPDPTQRWIFEAIGAECQHRKDSANEDDCGAPARWWAHVDPGDLGISICDAHKVEMHEHDVDNELDLEARWKFEPIEAST